MTDLDYFSSAKRPLSRMRSKRVAPSNGGRVKVLETADVVVGHHARIPNGDIATFPDLADIGE
jgi:hypothetical protein